MTSLYYSLVIAGLSSIVATFVGTLAAFGIHNMKNIPRTMVMNLTYLPVLNPDIVTGISFMLLFIFIQLRLGFLTLLLSHITFNIPYVILSVLPRIKQLNKNLYEAALDLGATPALAFRRVILPEIRPGVITGLLLAFTLSLDDFVVSFFTTGSGVSNLSIIIYSMARRGINPKINALSTLMFISVLTLLIIVNVLMSRQRSVKTKEG
jgi:spermidine/putrescine transport system permease protein